MILGLDIGGANTKAARSDGRFSECVYLPLWKGAPLDEVLGRLAGEQADAVAVAVVITGELADCYGSKREGVQSLKAAVKRAFTGLNNRLDPCHNPCPPPSTILFWGTSGFSWMDPVELAAANWSASAAFLARELGDCLFVDMGSTTTDLIPVRAEEMPAPRTDFMRLAAGELVYMGLLRTRLDAILPSARIMGRRIPLAPEYFAIMADARLVLDGISEESYTCDTADGAAKDRAAAMRRLARTACSDIEEIGEAGALAIARQACRRQSSILAAAIQKQAERHGLAKVAAAGIGEELIANAAERLGLECVRLSERYGRNISDVFPAYAVANLAEAELSGGL